MRLNLRLLLFSFVLLMGMGRVLATTFAAHTDEGIVRLLAMAWGAYRVPAILYVFGFIQTAVKTAEEGATEAPEAKA